MCSYKINVRIEEYIIDVSINEVRVRLNASKNCDLTTVLISVYTMHPIDITCNLAITFNILKRKRADLEQCVFTSIWILSVI